MKAEILGVGNSILNLTETLSTISSITTPIEIKQKIE
jgi:hypothetical protein